MHIKSDPSKLPQSPEEFVGPKNEIFCKILEDPKEWSNIPLLNYTPLHLLKDNMVVRFRGMIQDMQDPEFYLERYEVKRANDGGTRMQQGKFRDCLLVDNGEEVNYHAETNVQGERRILFVVSIPGINEWSQSHEEDCNRRNVPQIMEGVEARAVEKRAAPAEQEMEVEMVENGGQQNESSNSLLEGNKRRRLENETVDNKSDKSPNSALAADYLLNSPIPDRPSKACLVKIYKDFDSYTLNTIVDVVGFLSVDPSLDATSMDIDDENASELQAQNPPPSLIPRLHAIAVHHLPHANPVLDARLTQIAMESIQEIKMLALQKDIRLVLTLCLFNDDLAAEYLLSHLISCVYSRSELQSIGKFSINLCNLPRNVAADYTKQLYEIIEQLLPASHYLPMTLDTMNTAAFVPKKDYETNKLVSGLLQLAPHTHLVLDETSMQQGKLEASGVHAIRSLENLITHQQIKCDFQYYEIDYDVDIPVLVLSEGRSMLPSDISLPLKTDAEATELIMETLKAAKHYLSQNSRLDQFRQYLTHARTASFTMNPDDTEMIQNDFVEMRKANSVTTADDLHSLLVLSRLLAIARGKSILDKESWELAKQMETKRQQRIVDLPKPSIRVRQQ